MPANIIHTENYAALSAYSLTGVSPGDVFFVGGHTTLNDGGEGNFYYDSSSSLAINGGTILGTSGSGRWIRIFDDTVEARWFGAKFDCHGSTGTDDTSAIQGAINFALANGAKRVVLPNGCAKISAPLEVGNGGPVKDSQTSFSIVGQGRLSNSLANPVGGTAITFVGLGTCILRLRKSAYRFLRFADFSIGTYTRDDVQVGILFETSVNSQFTFDNIVVSGCTTSVQQDTGDGVNGEFSEFLKCLFVDFTTGYLNHANQAYSPKFLNCYFRNRVGGTIFQFDEMVGGQIIGCDSSTMDTALSPAVGDGISRLVNAKGQNADPLVLLGGRWEGIETLVRFQTFGTENYSPHLIFEGLMVTSFSNAANAIDVDSTSYQFLGIDVLIKNCTFVAASIYSDPIPWRIKPFGCSSSLIVIENSRFESLLPIVEADGNNQSSLAGSATARSRVIIRNCVGYNNPLGSARRFFIDKQIGTPPFSVLERRTEMPYLPHGGRQQNLLLQSNFGGISGAVAAPAPWTHTGNATFLASTPINNTGANPAEITPWGQRIILAGLSGVYQNTINLRSSAVKCAYYQARIVLRNLGRIRFALVNSDSGSVYDQVILKATDTDYLSEMVSLAALVKPISDTEPAQSLQLVIETLDENQVTVIFSYQFITTRFDGIFIPASDSVVNRTQFWDTFAFQSKVLNRLQVPYKSDSYGSSLSALPEVEAEIYQSTETGLWRMSYPEGWGTLPKQDVNNAAPLTGTWPLGWIRWNSSPVAGGKIGWICVMAGTPGTWKAFGTIDA